MPWLWDNEAKDWANVPEENVQASFMSGRFAFQKGTKINAVGDDGKSYSIPVENASKAFASGKFRYEQARQTRVRENTGNLQGIKGGAIEAGISTARGLTIGASDWLATRSLDASRVPQFDKDGSLTGWELVDNPEKAEKIADFLKASKEAHPGISATGELAGALAPILLSGGTLGAAKAGATGVRAGIRGVASKLPTALIDDLARVVENRVGQTVSKKLGEKGAQKLSEKLAQNVLPKIAGGVVEGMPYGVGQAITSASLENEDLTAQRLLAGAGLGGAIGGAALGGFGLAGTIAKEAARRAKPALGALGSPALEKAVQGRLRRFAAQRQLGITRKQSSDLLRAAKEADMEDFVEGILRKGGSVEDISGAISQRVDDFGEAIGNSLDDLDRAATASGEGFDIQKVLARINSAVLGPAEKSPVFRAKGWDRQIRKLRDQFAEETAPGFKQADLWRREIDKTIPAKAWQTPVGEKPLWDAQKKIRAIFAEEIESQLRPITEAAAPGMVDAWRAAQKQYAKAINVKKSVNWEKLAARAEDGTPLLSFGDTLVGSNAIGLGVMGSLMSGNPLPLIAGAAGAALKVGTRHAVNKWGPKAAFAGLDAITKKEATLAISRKVSQRIQGHLDRLMSGKLVRAAGTAAIKVMTQAAWGEEKGDVKPSKAAFKDRIAELRAIRDDPEAYADRVAQRLRVIRDIDPGLADNIAGKASTAAAFLDSKAPTNPAAEKTSNPIIRDWEPSDFELAKWARYVKAVEDPVSVFEDLENGRVGSEGAEALRVVYPDLYDEARVHLMGKIAEAQRTLPYDGRVQLSILFDVPMDSSMDPRQMALLQEAHGPTMEMPEERAARQPPRRGGAQLKRANSLLTETQRIASA